jgi:hypothetical protein
MQVLALRLNSHAVWNHRTPKLVANLPRNAGLNF